MLIFYRAQSTELWITIKSNEPLAVLDSGRVEDYFGVDGQLTLHNMDTGTRTAFLVTEDTEITPSIAYDAYTGFVDLTTTPDGIYQVEGRVRDGLGNYRILSDFQNPNGTEDITLFEVQISPLFVVVRIPKQADISLVEKPSLNISLVRKAETTVSLYDVQLSLDLSVKEKGSTDITLKMKPVCDLHVVETPELNITSVYTTI
jgi:hypothetical protein